MENQMTSLVEPHENKNEFLYDVIAHSIETIIARAQTHMPPLSLDELASQAGYSTAYFQKIFSNLTGVSPTAFQRCLNFNKASDFLLKGYSTLDSAYEAGLSGNGRLHDLYVQMEAVTPGQYASKGEGLNIKYGLLPTPLGQLFIGLSQKGLCWAAFAVEGSAELPLNQMKLFWKNAHFTQATPNDLAPLSKQLNNFWKAISFEPCDKARQYCRKNPIKLYLEGTNFQIKIWQALLKIPAGANVDYGSLGEHINKKGSGRAVGGAVGANPVSWIIPCHRVIRKGGIIHNYAWRPERKKSLLFLEQENNSPSLPLGL
jgi:AraC family transcriptional regulator of adaptative response/methylated-DNA-[protein]-cysteine methyltransferase